MELAPDLYEAAVRKGRIYADWKGQLDTLRAALDGLPDDQAIADRLQLALWERDSERVNRWTMARPEILIAQSSISSRHLSLALGYSLGGDEAGAREALTLARSHSEGLLAENPGDYRIYHGLGLAYAGLGLREEAVRRVDLYLDNSPYPPEDVYFGSGLAYNAAMVLAQAGLADEAVLLLRTRWKVAMRSSGAKGTDANLFWGPIWDPIRGHPAFEAFLEEIRPEGVTFERAG